MTFGAPEWTTERIETLKRMWGERRAFSEIGKELGVSRNACIGKALRLGLHRVKEFGPTAPRKPRVKRAPRQALRQARSPIDYAVASPPIAAEPEPMTESVRTGPGCSFMELTTATCRWPFGDPGTPEFFFCGGKTSPGSPYCRGHFFAAHQPTPVRQRQRPVPRSQGSGAR